MHAAVVSVTVKDPERAAAGLREQVVPQVPASPGFVAGYWIALGDDHGRAVMVYESQERPPRRPPRGFHRASL
jgi:hypothetical protein